MDLSLVIVFLLAAVIAVPIAMRLGFGAIIGYLVAGAAVGPHGLSIVQDSETVLKVSELGVVLLLFIIGLEINLNRLWTMRHGIFVLGGVQMLLSGLVLTGLVTAFGFAFPTAIVVGFVLALSATAFVLQLMSETGELASRHGRVGFTILLFQDLMVVPLLVIIPLLSGDGEAIPLSEALWAIARATVIVVGVVLIGRYLLRHILKLIATTDIREIFTAAALLMVVGTAALMEAAGLSAALGAFLAGVLTADSEYRHQLEADIEPFKGILLGLFFIAIGMTINLGAVTEMPVRVLTMVLVVMVTKAAILYVIARVDGLNRGAAIRLAGALPQAGEFAFVLFGLAMTEGLLSRPDIDFLYAVVVISMAATPVIYSAARKLTAGRTARGPGSDIAEVMPEKKPDVIIAGFGRVGQIIARIMAASDIPFTALDHSPERVEIARQYGAEVFYGDVTRLDLLEKSHIEEAKVFVVAVNDVETSMTIVRMLMSEWPHLTIVARANDRFHAYKLMDLGVRHIVRETFPASLDLAEKALAAKGYSSREAAEIVEAFRLRDENFLKQEYELHRDEHDLKIDSRKRNRELARLFRADRKEIEDRHSPRDVGDDTKAHTRG